jgi:O-antigen/teichoic acid export membrane protein
MLGILQGSQAVAVYVVVSNLSQLIVFSQIAINNVLAPNIASLYAVGNIKKLQNLVTQCTRLVSATSFVTTVILILSREWLLQLFGNEFIQGANALIILAIAQLVNASTGPVGLLLNMTGHERYTAMTASVGAITNTFLNLLLIPKLGVNGAAIATGISIIFINILNCVWVGKKISIASTALGKNFKFN